MKRRSRRKGGRINGGGVLMRTRTMRRKRQWKTSRRRYSRWENKGAKDIREERSGRSKGIA